MIKLSTLSVITPYLFSTASLAVLSKRKFNRLFISFLAFIFSIWIIIGCGIETIKLGMIMLIAGIPFYFGLKKIKKMEKYYVNPNIEEAKTLPSSFYKSSETFSNIKDNIFLKCWHLLVMKIV